MKIDLAAEVKRVGLYRKPEFIAAPIIPTKAQEQNLLRIYMRVVRGWQLEWINRIRPVYERTLAEPGFRDSVEDVNAEVETATSALSRLVVALGVDLGAWVVEIEEWHRGRFGRAFTPTGVSLTTRLGRSDVSTTLQAVLQENVALIKSLNDQMRGRVADAVFRGLTNRTPARTVAAEIQKAAGIGRRRAELIASDQLQKLTARLDQERQQQVGIDKFEWVHSRKKHPRPEHLKRDKDIFAWSSKVGREDPPGRAIRCGCRARAVLDMDEEE